MSEQNPAPQLNYAPAARKRPVIRPAIVWIALGAIVFSAIVSRFRPPWLSPRHGEQPYRVQCASNMRQIGMALFMWANNHGGQFPDQITDALEEDLNPEVFNCPSAKETPATGATTRAIAANLTAGGHLSYIYVGKGLTTKASADTVLLYEQLANHQNKGMNVLFMDGHVDFLQAKDVQPLLRQVANKVSQVRLP